ncbi:unnamed protein product [Linum trigynum]|uniref:Uncharacterized protein n=1 Tax=Linum trigynum TaxID=586398 RepID=A0AAV2CAL1_9ROSI
MPVAFAVSSLPLVTPANLKGQWNGQSKQNDKPVRNMLHFQPLNVRRHHRLVISRPVRLSTQLLSNPTRTQSPAIVCSVALNARCSASGQTQTVLKQSPTITQAPVREPTKTPEIDDGGPGLPPGDDGGGGGGGGGGGNWSGGFFLFGFLAFLGFLKDNEGEDEYGEGKRRRN